jgi:branched-chain amino acid transport system ATP-binding protein
MDTALSVSGLSVNYGAIEAVQNIDLQVPTGGITALLGANGAGKTTTCMAVIGVLRPATGTVSIFNTDMTGAAPDRIIRAGVAISPEGRRIFASLTVEENLILAGSAAGSKDTATERRLTLMNRFPILSERRSQLAGLLSGGEQQMLAVARALMSEPRLLVLDEPSLGLAPQMVDQIFMIIEELRHEGISILLVEQNATLALEVADHAVVLANGRVAAAGSPDELAGNAALQSAYLAA